ncbi:DUF22 domain-containing protein [Methanococcus voltae]|uniref:DUF22 domain-containing protein n=1 Tax=Methanococcus voltae (strain ATCC BAA-1334 / A3) TaxID=456320 RepID=D7DRU4_METV3|nr:DUF22 domain-containing protein [Methanococcus voltae]MCS3901172.1 hypothetical protein [Methanococcus voltae]
MFRIIGKIKKIEGELSDKNIKDANLHFELTGNKVLLLADEDITVKKGDIKEIKVEKIALEPRSVIVKSAYKLNKYGSVISVGEEIPVPFESQRDIDRVIFLATIDGEIKKGDLVGGLVLLKAEQE